MKRLLFAASLPLMMWASPAAAETVNCTNITAVPHTIAAPGVYCLKQDLATSITSGAAIMINANSVTIDFNGYKLGGLGGGPATEAIGVSAIGRKNITLRNGNIRGFAVGIYIDGNANTSSGHVIESNLLDANVGGGIIVEGSGIVVRDNRVLNTRSAGLVNAVAITLQNSLIVGNLITGTISTTSQSYALLASPDSANVEISNNTILDTGGNSFTGGMWIASAGNVVAENVVIGVTSATTTANGIWNTSGGSLICRDNTVANVTSNPTVGCTSESGTFPPVAP